jgi:hypothetical protein
MHMQVGESRSASIAAHARWMERYGIELRRGEICRLAMVGEWCDWKYKVHALRVPEPQYLAAPSRVAATLPER